MQSITSQQEVEVILAATSEIANKKILQGTLVYADGAANENQLFAIIQEACEREGFSSGSVELISGHKFPDVIFSEAQIGVEIKGHKQGDRILGNSIMGSTPSIANPIAIYLLAWNDAEKVVIWRDYFDCVIGAEVTHSPRFVLKPTCSPEESLFGNDEHQIGSAAEICLGEGGFKSEVILARMRAKALAEGNLPWWISPKIDDEVNALQEAQQQLSIMKYTSLAADGERSSLLKTLLFGLPNLFSNSGTKYDEALTWSLLRKSVLITRDAFSGGGRAEVTIKSLCETSEVSLPRILKIARDNFSSSSTMRLTDVEELWQAPIDSPETLLSQWRIRMHTTNLARHKKTVLHEGCACAAISDVDFVNQLIDWLLGDFKLEVVY